jgi:hypothetical protein
MRCPRGFDKHNPDSHVQPVFLRGPPRQGRGCTAAPRLPTRREQARQRSLRHGGSQSCIMRLDIPGVNLFHTGPAWRHRDPVWPPTLRAAPAQLLLGPCPGPLQDQHLDAESIACPRMTCSTLLRSAGLFWYSSPNGRLVHTTGRQYPGVIEAMG